MIVDNCDEYQYAKDLGPAQFFHLAELRRYQCANEGLYIYDMLKHILHNVFD